MNALNKPHFHQFICIGVMNIPLLSILTWHRRNLDHQGGSPRARPIHCTSVRLTLAITPNVGNSGA